MTTTIEEIRTAIEAANESSASGPTLGIVPFLGDRVESLHEPRFPNDGPIDGATLAKLLTAEYEMHEVAIENPRFDATVTIKGDDEIVMDGFFRGVFRHDGSELAHPVHLVWTVNNGKIVRFWVDASTPEIMESYQRQGEAFASPAVRPYLDKLLAITGGD